MKNENILKISLSPHTQSPLKTDKIMLLVILSLVPAMGVSIYVFGSYAVIQYIVSILSCVIFESIFNYLIKKENSIKDFSAVVTGILLAMNVPPTLPLWGIITGAFVSIIIAKMVFGGLGSNPFNPALVGRIFLMISFPSQMTNWILPDGSSGATVLGSARSYFYTTGSIAGFNMPDTLNTFLGITSGSLGETSAAALILGGVFLIATGVISWHIPVLFIGTVFIFVKITLALNPESTLPAYIHILSGGLILGAIYMATDYSSSPVTTKGKIIFAIGCGVLTSIIRLFGGYPEGVAFSILIMNSIVPLLDRFIKPRAYGEVKA